MKAYTDIKQGKKLAEILPIDSADAFYDMAEPEKRQVPIIGNPDDYYDMEDWTIPCWSLAALLEVLNMPALTQNNDDDWDVVINDPKHPDEYIEVHGSNPVDACIEMILKLKEKDLL